MDALTSKEFGHVKTRKPENKNFNFYSQFCEKRPFFWVRNDLRSGLVCSFSKHSKMAIFQKLAIKNSNSYFLVNILTIPNFWGLRAYTNVKSGQKFQLEPGKIRSEDE